MPTTYYGYYYPDASTELTPLAAILAAMAASSDAAHRAVPTVFNTIAERDASLTTPTEGRVVYTKDYNITWYYNGSGWKPIGTPTFATTTARDAALTSVSAGDQCLISSGATITKYIHNGTNWILAGPFHVRKGSDQTVTSSTTPTNDSDLHVDLPVGTYMVEAVLIASGPAAADIKIAWTFGGSGATYRTCMGPSTSTPSVADGPLRSASNSLGFGAPYGCDGSGSSAIRETIIAVVTSPGTLTLQFAQNSSNTSPTGLKSGSALVVIPL